MSELLLGQCSRETDPAGVFGKEHPLPRGARRRMLDRIFSHFLVHFYCQPWIIFPLTLTFSDGTPEQGHTGSYTGRSRRRTAAASDR